MGKIEEYPTGAIQWVNEEDGRLTPITAEILQRYEDTIAELCKEVKSLRDSVSHNTISWTNIGNGCSYSVTGGMCTVVFVDSTIGVEDYTFFGTLPVKPLEGKSVTSIGFSGDGGMESVWGNGPARIWINNGGNVWAYSNVGGKLSGNLVFPVDLNNTKK